MTRLLSLTVSHAVQLLQTLDIPSTVLLTRVTLTFIKLLILNVPPVVNCVGREEFMDGRKVLDPVLRL